MALRQDYYTPCAEEIDKKIKAAQTLIEELEGLTSDDIGVENSEHEINYRTEIERSIKVFESIITGLEDSKKSLQQ